MPRNISAEQGMTLQEKAVLTGFVQDTTALRAALVALLAKLDADVGVTDTNYAALLTPAALNVVA
jgi:hypothetical protein